MLEPKVIYENEDFLAIDKPSGLVVHPARIAAGKKDKSEHAPEEREPTLVDWLPANRPEVKTVGDDPATRPGIVHRLDKETSGVMLIAKTQKYFEYLKSLFQEHEIRKTYYAVVRGVPKQKEGIIDAPIGIVNGTLRRSVRSKKMKMRKEAVTEYKVIKEWKGAKGDDGRGTPALLEVHPRTGRTHQIRVHLASIGHPIIGDKLYGPKQKTGQGQPLSRLMLHAAAIEFAPQPGSYIKIESELPKEFT